MFAKIIVLHHMLSVWKNLEYWDQTLFLLINQDGSNQLFDLLMPWVREPDVWAPLYLFLLFFAIFNFGWKGALWCLSLIIAVSLSDIISSQGFKGYFGRLRPCNDPFIRQYLHFVINRCPSSFSFTSSHAANHFTIAAFVWYSFKFVAGKWLKLFFLWAFLVSYAQVYVGVHYPLDVISGAALGMLIGCVAGTLFNRQFPLHIDQTKVTVI